MNKNTNKIVKLKVGEVVPPDAIHLKTVSFLFYVRHYFLVDSGEPDFKRHIEIKPETVEAIKQTGSGVQWE